MFCTKCGSQLIESDAYCRTCGMPINGFLTPQMPFAQPEKIVLKSSWTKFLAYISTIVAYFLSGSFFGIGFLVPFAWFIYFCLYVSDKDKAKYYSIRDGKYRIDEKDVDEVIGYVAATITV